MVLDAKFYPNAGRASTGELNASQDAMNALARDTGGRPIFNTNALGVGLSRALQETSVYYLLAWKPNREAQEGKFRRIEVKLLEKPELSVRVRRGFYDQEPAPLDNQAKNTKPGTKTPEVLLRAPAGNNPDIMTMQDEAFHGFGPMVASILKMAEARLEILNRRQRETCPASDLVVGMQCGGSDAFSAICRMDATIGPKP